jgi:tetratricopeptide (TPR) repeat protein
MMAMISETFSAALHHYQAGNIPLAEALFQQVLAVDPNQADALHFLGLISLARGQNSAAAELIRQAISIRPNDVLLHCNLGNALQAQGKLDDAVACYRRALALEPDHIVACYNLAGVLDSLGRTEEAIACYQRALQLQPGLYQAHHNLGQAYQAQYQLEKAVACYRRALELQPDLAETHLCLGNVLYVQRKFGEAIVCYQRTLELAPNSAQAHANLAAVFVAQGKLAEAVASCHRALSLRPDFFVAYNNLGDALVAQGHLEQAIESYRRALELRPDYVDAHVGLGELQLLQGDLANGWNEYEWRWRGKPLVARRFQQSLWDGSPLKGKTILIHAEQGLGDTFQFIRYLHLVKAQGATLIMEVQKPLLRLLASAPGIDQLIGEGDELPAFDVHAPLLSLPRILQTALETIPSKTPYLFAERGLVDFWRKKLQRVSGFRVGVNWYGRSSRGAHRQRDIPIHCLASLAQTPGVRLISLQKGDPQQKLAAHGDPESVVDFGGDIDQEQGAFMDTAAIMMNLDVVISSDTSIAHLAGALGVPVWLALPFVPNWRWLQNRNYCPWYPTMRLFRQQTTGDWDSVFATVRAELNQRIRATQ